MNDWQTGAMQPGEREVEEAAERLEAQTNRLRTEIVQWIRDHVEERRQQGCDCDTEEAIGFVCRNGHLHHVEVIHTETCAYRIAEERTEAMLENYRWS